MRYELYNTGTAKTKAIKTLKKEVLALTDNYSPFNSTKFERGCANVWEVNTRYSQVLYTDSTHVELKVLCHGVNHGRYNWLQVMELVKQACEKLGWEYQVSTDKWNANVIYVQVPILDCVGKDDKDMIFQMQTGTW